MLNTYLSVMNVNVSISISQFSKVEFYKLLSPTDLS